MQIVPYRSTQLPGVYELYRHVVAGVPHCRFMPSLEYTGQALAKAEQAGAVLLVAEELADPPGRPEDGPVVSGVASLRPVSTGEDHVPQLEITGLFAPDEAVVAGLLAACLEQARGARRIVAFPMEHGHCPLPYNGGWDGLSDQLRPAARVLSRNGFAPTYRELHLEIVAPHFPPEPVPVPPDIRLVEGSGPNFESVRAMDGETEAGICLYMRMSKLSDHPDAHAWGYVEWLHVAETHRRRGLGRCLMSFMLRRLAEAGCRGCWLTTGGDNWPAQPLYLSLGFEILDTSSSWQR